MYGHMDRIEIVGLGFHTHLPEPLDPNLQSYPYGSWCLLQPKTYRLMTIYKP